MALMDCDRASLEPLERRSEANEDPADAWKRSAGQALLFLRHNSWVVPLLVGAVAVLTYGLSFRYYDQVLSEAGAPGGAGTIDRGEILSRALVLALLFLPGAAVAFPAFVASRTAWRRGNKRLYPILLVFVPVPIGIVLASEGVPSGTWLFVPILSLLPAYSVGALVGQWERVAAWVRNKRGRVAERHRPTRKEDTHVRIAVAFLVVLIVTALVVSIFETAARDDLAEIRQGGDQQILSATFVPLELRLAIVAWIDPTLRPVYEALLPCPLLLIGHRNGRTLLVEARPQGGHSPRVIDVNSGAVALREPKGEDIRACPG